MGGGRVKGERGFKGHVLARVNWGRAGVRGFRQGGGWGAAECKVINRDQVAG